MRIDARIPLVLAPAAQAGPGDALLLEGEGDAAPARDFFTATQTGHPPGCACCAARNEAAIALSRLLLARARGQGPFFRRVVAVTRTEAGRTAILEALASDPFASACLVLQEAAGHPSP